MGRLEPFVGWGDGPDVGINVIRTPEQADAYPPTFVPLDFTADEAIELGRKLIECGEAAKKLDRELEEYERACKERDARGAVEPRQG